MVPRAGSAYAECLEWPGPVPQPVFKTGEAWQSHAGKVRLLRRSATSPAHHFGEPVGRSNVERSSPKGSGTAPRGCRASAARTHSARKPRKPPCFAASDAPSAASRSHLRKAARPRGDAFHGVSSLRSARHLSDTDKPAAARPARRAPDRCRGSARTDASCATGTATSGGPLRGSSDARRGRAAVVTWR